jgi:hypothetical protein
MYQTPQVSRRGFIPGKSKPAVNSPPKLKGGNQMNLCGVSTFDCTTDDFRERVAEVFEEETQSCVSDWEIAVINDHKTCTMLNVTDMDEFEAIMTSPNTTEWDAANNCVDVVYSLEKMD